MAYLSDYFFHQQPPFLHGNHGQLMPLPLVMEESFDRSTGYLEDAVAGWANRFKRRRVLLLQNNEPELGRFEDAIQEFWNWGSNGSQFEDWSNSSDLSKSIEGTTKDHVLCEEGGSLEPDIISSSHFPNEPPTEALANSNKLTTSHGHHFRMENGTEERTRKKVVVGEVYPFTVVKPADVDGRVTLDDINKRVLSRPTRPVRHPVGEFACLPCVTAIAKPGLSGKVVVSLTRIHTQGRGTITIIRTRD